MRPSTLTARPLRTALAVLAGVAAISVVPACGGGGESDEDQVRSTVQQLADNDAAVCDQMTSAFVKASFGGKKADCLKAAKEAKTKGTISKVSVNGDKATATVKSKGDRTTTIGLVKDGDWKINSAKGSGGTSTASGSRAASTGSDDADRVQARAGAQALLAAIREGDANVFCGLLDEAFARKLLQTKEFGVAKCVQIFGKNPSLLQRVRRQLGDSTTIKSVIPLKTVDKSTGAVKKRLAIISLTNGSAITMHAEGSRYVVDRISD